VLLKDLRLNPDNPRFIVDERFKALQKSLQEFPKMMELRPIVVDKAAGMLVLGGNMRLKALLANGVTEVPDSWIKDATDLTPEEKKRFIIEDNVAFGEFNYGFLLDEELSHYKKEELVRYGMPEEEIYKIQGELDSEIPSENKNIDEEEMTHTKNECPQCGFKW